MAYAQDFVRLCVSQAGDTYRFGAEARWDDPDPDAFDCSELVEWALRRLGLVFPDGSKNQWRRCQEAQTTIAVHTAIQIQGALLFRMTGNPTHVAVSRGDGTTVEARGRAYGVNIFPAEGRGWTGGGLVPGLDYAVPPAAPGPSASPPPATSSAPAWMHAHGGVIHAPHYNCATVRRWQARMRERGWRITVDGDYGPQSRQVCLAFQREKRLQIDGVLGPQTWRAAWTAPIT